LAFHLYCRRDEIERLQRKEDAGSRLKVARVEAVNTSTLGREERHLLGQVEKRIRIENMFSITRSKVEALIEDATDSLNRGRNLPMGPGSFSGEVAVFGEYVTLFIVLLSISYLALGMRMASAAEMEWSTQVLLGVLGAIISVPIMTGIYRKRSAFPCVVCGKKTNRMIHIGERRAHLCKAPCEERLDTLFSILSNIVTE